MRVCLGIGIVLFGCLLIVPRSGFAQGRSETPESERTQITETELDAGTGDAGTEPACDETPCDEDGGCPERDEETEEMCDPEEVIHERRIVITPPNEGDVRGCGCGWYQMSGFIPFGIFGLGLVVGTVRRRRRSH